MNSKLQSLEKIVNSELSSKIKNSLIENNEFLIEIDESELVEVIQFLKTNENCKFTHHFSNLACPNCFCDWYLPWYHFGGDTSGCSCMGYGSIDNHYYLEVTKEVGGGASDVFINEKYTGSTLSDEYLFDADDAVFGGTGQICVNGTTLHSLPGLTQGGSVGGCIKKGNETQDVTQTPYSGGIFPKGTPGYGGGGTVCGSGGTGLVVVYWN